MPSDFATWIREWASREPTLLEGEYADLANLAAQQHEALVKYAEFFGAFHPPEKGLPDAAALEAVEAIAHADTFRGKYDA